MERHWAVEVLKIGGVTPDGETAESLRLGGPPCTLTLTAQLHLQHLVGGGGGQS